MSFPAMRRYFAQRGYPIASAARLLCVWLVCATCISCLSSCVLIGTSKSTRYIQYPVRPGDTLTGIAKRFGVFTAELKSLNDLDESGHVDAGTYIRVPYRGQSLEMNREDAEFAKTLSAKTKPAKGSKASDKGTRRVSIGSTRKYIGRLTMPVPGATVSSPFGRRWLRFHEGVDFRAAEGTRILAAHDGKVVFVSEHFSGYGKTIVLQGDEFVTVYAHMRKNRVRKGEVVQSGEWIADVGQTGDATGPHLHFETRIRDSKGEFSAVDPFTYLKK